MIFDYCMPVFVLRRPAVLPDLRPAAGPSVLIA